jgi:hypothetical protein
MLKRGFLKAEDLGKTEYFQIADGTTNSRRNERHS